MKFDDKAYLKEITKLLEKVRDFESKVTLRRTYNPVKKVPSHYTGDDIDGVVDTFSGVFGLKTAEANSIKDSLRSGTIDFFLYRTNEESLVEDHFAVLYILSRPFFHSLKSFADLDNIYWEDGTCPVCSAVPSLSLLEKDSQRLYCCSYCGSIGKYKRIGCPFCHNEDSERISIMQLQDSEDENVRIDACNKCKSYVKTFRGLPKGQTVEELDIQTLPLDIVAQNKGFSRRSPNAVGMIRFK
jgi:FdhE protein